MSEGPYRDPAGDDEGPPQRGIQSFVTWTGALVILVIAAFVVEGATRSWRTESGLREATEALGLALRAERVVEIARRYDPRALDVPALPELGPGEQGDRGAIVRVERDDPRALPSGARGALVRAGRGRIDPSHVALGALAAERPDQLRWIGVVRHQMRRDAYTYGAVSVDVERIDVAIVDLASSTLTARVAIAAAPPANVTAALSEYHVPETALHAAIADAIAR